MTEANGHPALTAPPDAEERFGPCQLTRATIQRMAEELAKAGPEDQLVQAIVAHATRTPEQIEATRAAIMARSRPERPLPPGKTLDDVVQGIWPGNETAEEIQDMLDDMPR